MSNTFGFVRLLAGLWLLTCCWQWACNGLPHRAISMKWNELGRCQVPRARREPAGIHVMPRCTSPGRSSQAMLCNPSLNYLSQCIERAVERLVLPPHLLFFFFFFFTKLLFQTELGMPWANTIAFCPNGYCWFALASSQFSFELLNVWLLFWLVEHLQKYSVCVRSLNMYPFASLFYPPNLKVMYFGSENVHFYFFKCRNASVWMHCQK